MGHIFQAEWWEKHPSVGVHWFMAKEISKGNEKGFGKEKLHFWHIYLWKQWKLGGKESERSQVTCEEEN